MKEMIDPLLHGWQNFYVIVGSSAAALTGLQFVVIALISEVGSLKSGDSEVKAFGTPQVVHFCTVLFLAAVCTTPGHSSKSLSISLTISAAAALAFTIRAVFHATRTTGYQPVWEDWLWHAILPLIAYISLLVAGICTYARPAPALYFVAATALLLLFVGIHNAWDTALYISTRKKEEARAASE
jgi:hypothetical protein